MPPKPLEILKKGLGVTVLQSQFVDDDACVDLALHIEKCSRQHQLLAGMLTASTWMILWHANLKPFWACQMHLEESRSMVATHISDYFACN
jgi:hypothetical protein